MTVSFKMNLHKINSMLCYKNIKRVSTFYFQRQISTNKQTTLDYGKPFSDIPKVKGLPVVGTLFEFLSSPYIKQYHKYLEKRVAQHGDIFKEKLGFEEETVFISNPDDFEILLTDEDRKRRTLRPSFWSIEAYAKKRNLPFSLIDLKYEEHSRIKNSIKKSLMTPREVGKSVPIFSQVTIDLIKKLQSEIMHGNSKVFNNFEDYIYPWTFECSTVTVFGKRLGMFSNSPDEDGVKLSKTLKVFWDELFALENGFSYHKSKLTKLWKSYEETNDDAINALTNLLDKYPEQIIAKTSGLSDMENMVLCLDVMRAAAHTTTQTAVWALELLSRNTDVQEKIYEEITKVLEKDGVSYEMLQKMPYLRGCLKEVFRMKPIVPIYGRITSSDLVLSGYNVPSGTRVFLLVGMCNKENYFYNCQKMNPERWLRSPQLDTCPYSEEKHPFSLLPFGHGMRMCPGRRIAETMLLVFIASVCQNFKIHSLSEECINEKFNAFLVPDGPVSFRLEKR